ncbi:VTT domain-containing protein, partial [Patescibacteria group bacterium]|nr:VTT domain-containing protein [Patescibacteria group bacterium]
MINKRTIAVFIAVVVIAILLYFSVSLRDLFLEYVVSIGDYLQKNKTLGAIVFVGISALSVLISPFSSVPLVPSAIMAWGNFLTFGLLIAGWMIGAIFAYLIGSFSRKKIIARFVSLEKVEYYKQKISARSQFFLVLLFRLAIPSEVAGYTLGIVQYNFSKYVIATFLAELPYAFFVVYLSAVLVSGRISLFIGVVILGIILFFLPYR